jgi:hypothetical protein
MTQFLLCYRVIRVARHLRCRGEDLPQMVHLPRGRHRLRQDSGHLQVQAFGVLPHSRIQISLPTLLDKRVKVIVCHQCRGELHQQDRHRRPLDRLR